MSSEDPETEPLLDILRAYEGNKLSRSSFWALVVVHFGKHPTSRLPAALRWGLRRQVSEAPKTDEEWTACPVIIGGCFVSEEAYRKATDHLRDEYRAGIEQLRKMNLEDEGL